MLHSLFAHNVLCIHLTGMQSSSLKLFSSADQKPMLLKRQAFSMFSGELDQYHLYLPLIQGEYYYWILKWIFLILFRQMLSLSPFLFLLSERLTEALRSNSSPAVFAQMFLMFRVLLLRISPQHLTSLWPIMVTELVRCDFSRTRFNIWCLFLL